MRDSQGRSRVARRFLLYVPKLNTRSNGIALLYELAYLLHDCGEAVALVCHEGNPYDGASTPEAKARYASLDFYRWNENFGASDVRPDDIGLYSDSAVGNPMGTARTVRYLMNIPGLLVPEADLLNPHDFLVAYSYSVDPVLPQLFLLNTYAYHPTPWKKKNQVAVHFGKTNRDSLRKNLERTRGLVGFSKIKLITRNQPRQKSELVKILSESRLLISFDPLSNIHYETTLLGTPVFVADDSIYQTSKTFNIPLIGVSFTTEECRSAFHHERVVQVYRQQADQGNRENVRSFVQMVEAHFDRWEGDFSYQKACDQELKNAQGRWSKIHQNRNAYQLENIDEFTDIPYALFWRSFPQQALGLLFRLGPRLYLLPIAKRVGLLFEKIFTLAPVRTLLGQRYANSKRYSQLKSHFMGLAGRGGGR